MSRLVRELALIIDRPIVEAFPVENRRDYSIVALHLTPLLARVGLDVQQLFSPCLGILDGDISPRAKLHSTELAALDKVVGSRPRRAVDVAEIANCQHFLVHAQLQ